MKRRQERWVLLALFAVMATLEVGLARRQCLWGDEIFSVAVATGHSLENRAAAARPELGDFVEPDRPVPAQELRRYLKHETPPAGPARVVRAVLLSDTSPPLYYLLLYCWTIVLGTSDFVLRLFSVAWSLACFPLLAGVARRTGGRPAVLPSCVLLALSPLGLYFSSEVRMYSLLVFLALAAAWVTLVLHRRRAGGLGLYVLWVGISAAGFLTHYFFLFPWLALIAFLLINPGKISRPRLALCMLALALVLLPWYVHFPQSMESWRVTQGWLKLRPRGFHRLRASRNLYLEFFSGDGYGLWPGRPSVAHAAILLSLLVAGAMLWRLRGRVFAKNRLLLWLWFIAACAAPSAMDLLQGTYSANNPRYALAALPAAYLLAGLGLASLRPRFRWAMLLLISLAWAPSLVAVSRQTSRNLQPLAEVARVLDANATSADMILIHSIPSGVLGFARYANGAASIASWVQQLGSRQVPGSIASLTAARKRVFLVKLHTAGAPAPEEEWLRVNAEVFEEKHLQDIKIIAFQPKDGATF